MKKHRKEFLEQALPNIFSNLSAPLAGLVDTAMLGHLPRIDALAGVALAGVIFSYLYWGFGFLRMGTTGLVAKADGSDDPTAVGDTFFRAMSLALGFAFLFIWGRELIGSLGFGLLQGSEEVERAGQAYFSVRILGAPAVLGLYVVNGWLIGRGMPRVSFVLSLVLNFGNIALDALFIYYLQWGAYGAGLATALAAGVTFVLGLFLIWRRWGNCPRFEARRVFEAAKYRPMLVFKVDIMVRTLCLILALTTFTNLSAGFGKLALAANTLLMKLLTLSSYLIDGFAFALEAIAGKAAGAGDSEGVKRTLRIALDFSVKTGLVMVVLTVVAGSRVLGLLTSHVEVVQLASGYLPYVALALVFSTFSYVYDGLFIGLANGRILRNSMALATACFLPLVWYAHQVQSLTGMWLSMVIFMAVRTGALVARSQGALRDL